MDIAIDDGDGGNGRNLQMVWAGTGRNFRDPTAYGRLLLRRILGIVVTEAISQADPQFLGPGYLNLRFGHDLDRGAFVVVSDDRSVRFAVDTPVVQQGDEPSLGGSVSQSEGSSEHPPSRGRPLTRSLPPDCSVLATSTTSTASDFPVLERPGRWQS